MEKQYHVIHEVAGHVGDHWLTDEEAAELRGVGYKLIPANPN